MEEIINVDAMLAELIIVPPTYIAVFNPETGEVISVGPETAFEDQEHKIPLDKEIAESIIDGKIRISSCFVDMTGSTLEIAEEKSVFKIDDVLHRIVETQWSDIEKPEIYLEYNRIAQTLTIELTEEFYGTRIMPDKFQPVAKRKVIWGGDTVINLLITDYNDPNLLYRMLSLTVSELVDNKKIFTHLELPNRFSIYTRRIFKNYILEVI